MSSSPRMLTHQSAESLMAALAHVPASVMMNPTSSWELEEDWSERCGGSTGSLSSSIMTLSSCGMFTVGDSWHLPDQWKGEILDVNAGAEPVNCKILLHTENPILTRPLNLMEWGCSRFISHQALSNTNLRSIWLLLQHGYAACIMACDVSGFKFPKDKDDLQNVLLWTWDTAS